MKLLPDAVQAPVLAAALAEYNAHATWLAGEAHGLPSRTRAGLQGSHYAELKARGLSAQPALHVIRKVADAYKTLKANLKAGNHGPKNNDRYQKIIANPITFRSGAAHSCDDRCLSWQHDALTVSILTPNGRLKNIRFTGSPDGLKMLRDHRKGETDLQQIDGQLYLIATCDITETPLNNTPTGWIGVDLGITNIATLSTNGRPISGDRLNRYRRNMIRVRAELQAKGTQSAKRLLKKRNRREQRHAANQNHIIAKQIVTEAQRTGRGIALEDLTGIRERVRLRKPQRVTLHSCAFAQLGAFVQYKAHRAGVPVVHVNPAYTSQDCSWCGHRDKNNRTDQASFACRSCGVVAHADWNGSRNIEARAPERWAAINLPHAAEPTGNGQAPAANLAL
ncbi:RNA-guided endonuclease InsQ/TnpB family protein [Streptomyces sp. NPDC054865]